MSDLGSLQYFLGIAVTQQNYGLHLNEAQYARDLLARVGMTDCNASTTPVDTSNKLDVDAGPPVNDPTLYRSLAGGLQYLTLTRPDIAYVVQQVCLHMHDPREGHLNAMKRVFRYVKGTPNIGLLITDTPIDTLTAYSNADWVGCPATRRSTSGYCVYLGSNLISWSFKHQATVSRSNAEAEYRSVANAVAE